MTEKITSHLKDPLPKRYHEVAVKRALLEQGIVLSPDGYRTFDFYDTSNACQALIIEQLSERLIATWESPALKGDLPFYQDFAVTYYYEVMQSEEKLWQELVQELVSNESLDMNELTPHQAAVLTLSTMSGFENAAASSAELFVELALHAEVYKKLLQERFGAEFTDEMFYDCLRTCMPTLMKRLIAMDSVVIDYYRANVMDRRNLNDPDTAEYYKTPLDAKFFVLTESNDIRPNPKLIELFKQAALEKEEVSDTLGRTVNRGCPFLRADNQDALIHFAIDELIKQRENYLSENNS